MDTYAALHNRGHALVVVGPFEDDNAAKSWFRRVGSSAYFGYTLVSVMTPETYEER